MNDVNFLPSSYVRQRARHMSRARQRALIGIAALCLVGWWFTQRSHTASLREEAERLEEQARVAQEQQTELVKLRREYSRLAHQVKVQQELAQPVNHTQVLAVLGEVLPSSIAMRELDMKMQRPQPVAADKADATGKKGGKSKGKAKGKAEKDLIALELVCVAPDDLTVANAIGAVSGHPLFSGVMLRHIKPVEFDQQGKMREFRMVMNVDLARQFKPARLKEGLAHAD